ncbi:hypothetical protein [Microcella sp.]|uniref:hypothetical protein n=1 Tax=Microcella sp. TaxID=1913979 RepID=UPI00391D79EE
MPATVTRDSFRSTLVEYAIEHSKPDGTRCTEDNDSCPLQQQLERDFRDLIATDDVNELITVFLNQLLHEGAAIARTRQADGGLGLAGYRFEGSATSGMLAGALMLSRAHGNDELGDAARTILRFGPPRMAHAVLSVIVEQLVISLVERHQEMLGTPGSH